MKKLEKPKVIRKTEREEEEGKIYREIKKGLNRTKKRKKQKIKYGKEKEKGKSRKRKKREMEEANGDGGTLRYSFRHRTIQLLSHSSEKEVLYKNNYLVNYIFTTFKVDSF